MLLRSFHSVAYKVECLAAHSWRTEIRQGSPLRQMQPHVLSTTANPEGMIAVINRESKLSIEEVNNHGIGFTECLKKIDRALPLQIIKSFVICKASLDEGRFSVELMQWMLPQISKQR